MMIHIPDLFRGPAAGLQRPQPGRATVQMGSGVNLEIFSDLICPWCFIGKRRLDRALESMAGEPFTVVWRAYQLYPDLPASGMARADFMRQRYGPQPPSGVRERIAAEAGRAGVAMDFDGIARMPNTFAAHRLVHLARREGVQHALVEALFRAYFQQGRDLGDVGVLLDAAAQQGMDRQAVADYLASGQGADAVQGEMDRAADIGVSGVPCFVFAGTFALPGAQEPEVLVRVMERVREKLSAPAG